MSLERPAVALFGAYAQMCALLDDSALWCWGLEYSRPPDGGRPWRVDLPAVPSSIYTVSNGVCALVDGAPWCWGWDVDGLFARPPPTHTADPVVGATVAPMVAVGCGIYHCCGLDAEEHIECWGRNNGGNLGFPPDPSVERVPPTVLETSFVPVDVAAGNASCAIDREGALYCWGSRDGGWNALGDREVHRPTQVDLPSPALQLRTDIGVACVLLGPTSLRCWGYNGFGAVGDGTMVEVRSTPAPVVGFE